MDELDKAIHMYKQVLEIDEKNELACSQLLWLFMKTKLYEEALIYSEKSIEINPNNYNVYNNLGYVYFGMDDLEKAIECWEKSL
ncbi:unnamed protein product [marine sediment metagenome]|uniref:Uncharacterized protein n=1 Tax=marine sediment metagenome TaxID=412755 RepID=X1LRE3_9ZZZZ